MSKARAEVGVAPRQRGASPSSDEGADAKERRKQKVSLSRLRELLAEPASGGSYAAGRGRRGRRDCQRTRRDLRNGDSDIPRMLPVSGQCPPLPLPPC